MKKLAEWRERMLPNDPSARRRWADRAIRALDRLDGPRMLSACALRMFTRDNRRVRWQATSCLYVNWPEAHSSCFLGLWSLPMSWNRRRRFGGLYGCISGMGSERPTP